MNLTPLELAAIVAFWALVIWLAVSCHRATRRAMAELNEALRALDDFRHPPEPKP